MGPRLGLATLALWVVGAAEAIAQRAGGRGAPEIDGPAGIAALVLLVGVGLLAYNRFRK